MILKNRDILRCFCAIGTVIGFGGVTIDVTLSLSFELFS
jgi:hypothetical protein